MKDKGWLYIVIGGIFEIVWAISMKHSDGFTNIPWTASLVLFLILSMIMLSKAIAVGMPLGIAYAVWVGIGAIGTFVYGVLFMNDPSDLLRIFFAGMVIAGIVGLQRTSRNKSENC
ncbi:MAG: multidrug efflux SMR transporter [Methanomassiliicoccaceae archaeon]|jgi:quaternary ammonium compound-resistance protein SugE|nr:multidrug efflux SMR transporter [Methanomassiliicoccaceae archaeon]